MIDKIKDFYYKKSRLNQLRGFCTVVQNDCSIVKSSQKLNIESASVSKQITSLERDLGTKLFDRTNPKTLVLTEDGKLFYELSIKELHGIDSIFETFNKKIREKNDNTLNLGLHYTAASYIFPKIIGKMLKEEEFKNLKINIFNINKDEAIKKVINKEIDLAFYPFGINEIVPTEINYEQSLRYNHALIFSKNHQLAKLNNISREDVEKYDFLIRDIKSSFSISEYLKLKKSNIDFCNATTEITVELIKYTDTITAIPEVIFDTMNKENIVCRNINHLLPESYFYIITLKNIILKKSVKWLIKQLNILNKN